MIKNEMIKLAVPFMKQTIVKVFKKLLKLGHFPIPWTEGIIVPIHKQGNCSDPNNYRGITLNSCLGKLFCHTFNSRISNHVENTYFLAKEQADFRKNFRTSDQSFILKTLVDKYFVEMVNQINYMHALSTSRKLSTVFGMRVCY